MARFAVGAAGGLAEALGEAEELAVKQKRTKIAEETLSLQKSKRAGELWGQVDAIHTSTDTPEVRKTKLSRLLPEIERLEGRDEGFYTGQIDTNPVFISTVKGDGRVEQVSNLLGDNPEAAKLILSNPEFATAAFEQAKNLSLIDTKGKLAGFAGDEKVRKALGEMTPEQAKEFLGRSEFFKSQIHREDLDKIFSDPGLLASVNLPELGIKLQARLDEAEAKSKALVVTATEKAKKRIRPTLADIRVDIFNRVNAQVKEGKTGDDVIAGLNPLEKALFQLPDDEPTTVRELVGDLVKQVARMTDITGAPLDQAAKDEVILSAAMSLFPFDQVNAYWEKVRGVSLQQLKSPDGTTKLVEVTPEGEVKVVATEPEGGFFAFIKERISETRRGIGLGVRAVTAAEGEEVLAPEGGPPAAPTLGGDELLATLNTEAEVISAVGVGRATEDEGVARIKEMRAAKK